MLIEAKVIAHLKDKLGTDYVYAEMPEQVPPSFVLVSVRERTRANYIDRATLETCSYAMSKAEASALNDFVMASMESRPEHDEISAARFGGCDDDPDAWLEMYRYRSVFNLVYYDD